MAQSPITNERHREENDENKRGNDNRANEFTVMTENFHKPTRLKELKQKEEIPLRPRCRVRLSRISGRAEVRTRFAVAEQTRFRSEEQHHGHDGKARDDILQYLVWPERAVRSSLWLGRRQSVFAEKINVSGNEEDNQSRQHSRVQREEARQRVMPIIRAADDDLLQRRPNHRRNSHDVGRDLRGPIT